MDEIVKSLNEDFRKKYGDFTAKSKYVETLRYTVERGDISLFFLQRRLHEQITTCEKYLSWMLDCGYIVNGDEESSYKANMTMGTFEKVFGGE